MDKTNRAKLNVSVAEASANGGHSIINFTQDGIIVSSCGQFPEKFSEAKRDLKGMSIFDLFKVSQDLTNSVRKVLDGVDNTLVVDLNESRYEVNFLSGRAHGFESGAMAVINERTGEKLAETAFLTSDYLYRILFNNSQESIFVYPIEENLSPGKFIEVNATACRKLGYTRKELLALTPFDIEGEELMDIWKDFSSVLLSRRSSNYESNFRTSNGRKISVQITANFFQLGGKNLVLATARDVSVIRDAEAIIDEVHMQYQNLIDTTPDGIIIHKDLIIQYSNQSAALILGFERVEDIIGKSLLSFLHTNMHEKITERMQEIIQKKDFNPPNEYTLLLRGNISREVEVTDTYFQFRHSPAVLTILRDISERRNTRKEISQRQRYLESLLMASPMAIITQDMENKVVEWNAQAERLFGYPKDEALGKNIYSLIARPDVIEEAKKFTDELMKGEPSKPIESVRYRKDNKPVNVKISGSPLKEGSNLFGIVYAFQNLEEYQEMEIARLKVEKTLRETLIQVGTALSRAQELRDPYTSGHGVGVSILAIKIAEMIGWDRDRILGLELAGLLHDIGKLGVPIEILVKPTELNASEHAIIQLHPQMGYDLLKDIPFPFPIAEAVYQHHERMNGTGYPNKLKGAQIIPEAKILAVCDLIDAMSAFRPYREGYRMEDVTAELKRESGKKYDTDIVNIAILLLKKYNNQRFWPNP